MLPDRGILESIPIPEGAMNRAPTPNNAYS